MLKICNTWSSLWILSISTHDRSLKVRYRPSRHHRRFWSSHPSHANQIIRLGFWAKYSESPYHLHRPTLKKILQWEGLQFGQGAVHRTNCLLTDLRNGKGTQKHATVKIVNIVKVSRKDFMGQPVNPRLGFLLQSSAFLASKPERFCQLSWTIQCRRVLNG